MKETEEKGIIIENKQCVCFYPIQYVCNWIPPKRKTKEETELYENLIQPP